MSNVTGLPILFCLLVDFPDEDNNNTDCEILNGIRNEDNCFRCSKPGRYLFSEHDEHGDHEHGSAGHIICLILWICTVVMGIFGTFANSLVITVLRKRRNTTSFDVLLYVLASLDLIISLATLLSATGIIFYLENWDRGLFTLTYYYFSILIFFFGKTSSQFMTVFITVERYLVIANPIKSRVWFSLPRTKLMTLGVILLAVIFNIPRISSIWIGLNDKGKNVPSLSNNEYIIFSTMFEKFWYTHMKSIHYVDVFAPFPLLIIFNVLLFIKISTFSKTRKQLTKKQRSDIRAARMFIPVVVVLFLCNVVPMVYYIVIRFCHISHRELFFGMLLSVAINSAANLPIYYARGGSFRAEIRSNLPEWLKPCFNRLPQKEATEITGTGTGTAGPVSNEDGEQMVEYFIPQDCPK